MGFCGEEVIGGIDKCVEFFFFCLFVWFVRLCNCVFGGGFVSLWVSVCDVMVGRYVWKEGSNLNWI